LLYHVNNSGEAGACKAAKGKCPFGSADEHFTSAEAARVAYESSQETFGSNGKKAQATSNSFGETFPAWEGKLPGHVERKILAKLQNELDFMAKVDSGEIETRYASVNNFLSPPIHAIRDRGESFENDELEIDYDLGEDEFLISLNSRQGGGNDECYCDDDDEDYDESIGHVPGCTAHNNELLEAHPQYVGRYTNDFDSTYITHYFAGGFTTEDVVKNNEQRRLRAQANLTRDLVKNINEGYLPPWAVLAEKRGHSYRAGSTQLADAEKRLKDVSDWITAAEKVHNKIKAEEPFTPEEAKTAEAFSKRGFSSYTKLVEYHGDVVAAKEKLAKQQRMVAEAEALPDGDLKDYLIGDRGTMTVDRTKKVGRRNVPYKDTIQRGTLLGTELESAKRGLKNARSSVKTYGYDTFQENVKAKGEELKRSQDAVKTTKKAREEAWKDGWPGLARELPAMPPSF